MRRALPALAGALALFLSVHAKGADPARAPGEAKPVSGDAEPIQVTINPEGRVSVAFLGPLPPPMPRCR